MTNNETKQKYFFLYNSKTEIIQNLKDAGCNQKIIDYCLICLNERKKEKLLKQLQEHREVLLNKVHKVEKQISCLDYLVFQIEKYPIKKIMKPINILEK